MSDTSIPERLAAAVRSRWPAGTILRDGRVVGAWVATSRDGETHQVAMARIDLGGEVHGHLGTSPSSTPSGMAALFETSRTHGSDDLPSWTFGRSVAAMRRLDADGLREAIVADVGTIAPMLAPGLSATDARNLAVARYAEITDILDAFLSTLDQDAILAIDECPSPRMDMLERNLSALDENITPGTPLKILVRDHPHLVETIVPAWERDQASRIRADLACPDAASPHPSRGSPGTKKQPRPATWRPLAHIPHEAPARDDAGGVGREATRDAIEAIDEILRVLAPGRAGDLLGIDGGLGSWIARLQASTPRGRIRAAAEAVREHAEAFMTQVVEPALTSTKTPFPWEPGDRETRQRLGTLLLCSGLDIFAILEARGRWSVRRILVDGTIRAMHAAPDGGEWDAVLPCFRRGYLSLDILVSAEALAMEGMTGHRARQRGSDPTYGVGADLCRSGKVRVGAIRETATDGTKATLGVVRFDVVCGTFQHPVHVDLGKGAPRPEAHALAREYADAVLAGQGVKGAIATGPAPHAAGYDADVAGLWDKVMGLWRPILPDHLAGLDAAGIASAAALWTRLARRRGWMPAPVGPVDVT